MVRVGSRTSSPRVGQVRGVGIPAAQSGRDDGGKRQERERHEHPGEPGGLADPEVIDAGEDEPARNPQTGPGCLRPWT